MVKKQYQSASESEYDDQSSSNLNAKQQYYRGQQKDNKIEQQSYLSKEQEEQDQEQQQKINKLKKEEQRIKQQLKQLPYGLILKQKLEVEKQKNALLNKKQNKNKKNSKNNKDKQDELQTTGGIKEKPIHKKPIKRIPVIFQPTRQKTIDPRFQDYAGSYNQDLAMKSFDFIPKIQQQQIKALKGTLQKSKALKHSTRKHKKLSQGQKQRLIKQYNKLTNEKRQIQLMSIEKQAKHNVKERQYEQYSRNSSYYNKNNYGRDYPSYKNNNDRDYPSSNYNNKNYNRPSNYVPKQQLRKQFQKIKIDRMGQQQKAQYLKNKQKKIQRNKDIQRNNMVYQTTIKMYGKK